MVAESLGLQDRLRVFRRRLRWLLAWRWGTIGGFVGLLVALALDLFDWFGWMLVTPARLVAPVLTGLLLGIGYAIFRPLPPHTVAVMVDRRGQLKDRIQTALERTQTGGVFDQPLIEDAIGQIEQLRPARLFTLRFGAWQAAFFGALFGLLIVHYLPFLPFVNSEEKRQEQKEVQAMAKQVQEVAKPIMAEVKRPNADEVARQIARNVELYGKRAQQGRMDKKEALLKMNELMAQAQKLEKQSSEKLQQVAMKAESAAEQMQKASEKRSAADKQMSALMQQMDQLQRQLSANQDANGQPLSSQQRTSLQNQLRSLQATIQAMQNPGNRQAMQNQMDNLQKMMSDIQNQLQSGKDNQGLKLSKEAMEALKQQMQSLQQQMRALQLSKEAREFLQKLFNDPKFLEAMKKMQELAKKAQQNATNYQNQSPEQRKMTAEEIEKMAKELEKQLNELAKKYDSDEKVRQLAQQILDQVKQMKDLAGLCSASQGIGLGLGLIPGMGGMGGNAMGMGGGGLRRGTGPDNGTGFYSGQAQNLNPGEKHPELKIPLQKRGVQGQNPLTPGPADYIEYDAPPTPGDSSVPLNRVLPSYQKSAENALNKQDIPPSEKKRVKQYFDSLNQGK